MLTFSVLTSTNIFSLRLKLQALSEVVVELVFGLELRFHHLLCLLPQPILCRVDRFLLCGIRQLLLLGDVLPIGVPDSWKECRKRLLHQLECDMQILQDPNHRKMPLHILYCLVKGPSRVVCGALHVHAAKVGYSKILCISIFHVAFWT